MTEPLLNAQLWDTNKNKACFLVPVPPGNRKVAAVAGGQEQAPAVGEGRQGPSTEVAQVPGFFLGCTCQGRLGYSVTGITTKSSVLQAPSCLDICIVGSSLLMGMSLAGSPILNVVCQHQLICSLEVALGHCHLQLIGLKWPHGPTQLEGGQEVEWARNIWRRTWWPPPPGISLVHFLPGPFLCICIPV